MSNLAINVRGTSGSGKTSLIRRIMEEYPEQKPIFVEGRKRPLYYELNDHLMLPNAYLLGHYETACGGCDTITSMDQVFDLVAELAQKRPVLFEGLLISADAARTIKLQEEQGIHLFVALIDEPLELCLESVNARRREKNPEAAPVNPKNTENKWKGSHRSADRLEQAGIEVFRGSREVCYNAVRQVLSNAHP